MAIENNGYGFNANVSGYGNGQGGFLGGTFADTLGDGALGEVQAGPNGLGMFGAMGNGQGAVQGALVFQPDQLQVGFASPFFNMQSSLQLPGLPPPPPPPAAPPSGGPAPAPGMPQPMLVPPQLGFLAGMLPGFFRVG